MPTLNIPIAIPVTVRTGDDYGLRFTVSDITQLTPLAGADITIWGFPAEPEPRRPALPERLPGNPAGCPGLADASCNRSSDRGERPQPPVHRQPDHLQRRAAGDDTRRRDLPGPRPLLPRRQQLPGDHRLRERDLQTAPPGEPDHQRDRLRLGPRHQPAAPTSSRASPPRPRRSSRRSSPCPQG